MIKAFSRSLIYNSSGKSGELVDNTGEKKFCLFSLKSEINISGVLFVFLMYKPILVMNSKGKVMTAEYLLFICALCVQNISVHKCGVCMSSGDMYGASASCY